MSSFDSYWEYQMYEQRGEQDPIPVYPNVYSIDADGTMQKVLKKENDTNCGYIPPVDIRYRWVNLDPSKDYWCDECPYEPQYRWVNMNPSTDYYCEGTTKYYKQKKQVSYDGGQTWEDVVPAEYQMGSVYETESTDCGYVPPQYRWVRSDETICVEDDYTSKYLTFVAEIDGTFKFSGNNLQYSLDSGTTWVSLPSDTNTPTVQSGKEIWWKQTGLTPSSSGIGRFSSTAKYEVEGNIMSLIFGDDFEDKTDLTGYNNAFKRLFNGDTHLISAERLSLPATTLSDGCYQDMFSGCISLSKIPQALPATTLASKCYEFMFYNCTSLTTAPELPATTLASNCCYGMFYNCTSLTTAPELPATTLANWCYNEMFRGCTSLTAAPSILPATTLADSCYEFMFQNCTSLTTAPELPATTLASKCCYGMFYNCTSLNYVKCLATNISARRCTVNWLNNVASTGTFVTPSSTNWESGDSGIPTGWTRVNV